MEQPGLHCVFPTLPTDPQALGDPAYTAVARKALTFVRQKGYVEASQELLHCCGTPGPALPAVHADYAYFIQVCVHPEACTFEAVRHTLASS